MTVPAICCTMISLDFLSLVPTMAGLDHPNAVVPSELKLHKKSRQLEISFDDGVSFHLSYEFLRVFSPSAEVRGHGPGQEVLQTGKRDVDIVALEPVGNYAVKPIFSDGHESGIYSWDVLHELCLHHDQLWQTYLARLEAEGASRDIDRAKLEAKAAGCHSKQ